MMPKGMKGFQVGNKLARGGARLGAGRPRHLTPRQERLAREEWRRFDDEAVDHVNYWINTDPRKDARWTPEQVQHHRFLLRVLRQSGHDRKRRTLKAMNAYRRFQMRNRLKAKSEKPPRRLDTEVSKKLRLLIQILTSEGSKKLIQTIRKQG